MLSQPLPRVILLYMLFRNHKIRESHGPLQSNGICLLDLPFHSHLKPIASTSLAMALPHVATVPGPVSLPGALIDVPVCLYASVKDVWKALKIKGGLDVLLDAASS